MPNLTEPIRFDAHCHLFNLKYLALELGHMLEDAATSQYPHRKPESGGFPHDPIRSIKGLIAWLRDLQDAGFDDEEEHLEKVQKAGQAAWNDGLQVACIPLMMDIYFLFSDPVYAHEAAPQRTRRNNWIKRKLFSLLGMSTPYYDSTGFNDERKALLGLVSKHPGQLYPFFAIDPRRTGIIAEVMKGKIVSKSGPFYGIKLYPRIGYHPQAQDLWPLYAWCEKNHIPIITHCDEIGFPPPAAEKLFKYSQADFGNPNHFAQILEQHKTLKIDFAHFGMSNRKWADTIASFMDQYENVYSDLSCYTTAKSIADFKTAQWAKPKVAERTMFGTDFNVNVAVSPGLTLQTYYRNFMQAHNPGGFSPAELSTMSITVPKNFLA